MKRLYKFLHEHLRFKVICEACDKEDSIEDAFDKYIAKHPKSDGITSE
jgi:hypothetical protein